MTRLRHLTPESLRDGLHRMNVRVLFAAILGIGLFIAVYALAPEPVTLDRDFYLSLIVLAEVTLVSLSLRLFGQKLMHSRAGVAGWRGVFIFHSTAYALTWGLACMRMIERLQMSAYSISVTTTALAACTVAVSTFSFDFVACFLFLSSLLLPLLKGAVVTDNGAGLAGACTLSITFFMYLAWTIHRTEVDGRLNEELIRRQADQLNDSNELFRRTIESIDEIFLVIGLDGICYGNQSARARRLLGLEPVGEHVGRILRMGADADLRNWFELLAAGRFDLEQLIPLAPQIWEDVANGLTYRIAWFPMETNGALKSVIMTLTDITQKLKHEGQARRAEERARLILSITGHREHFARFIARVRELRAATPEGLRKDLHDLKGFAGIFGFASFVSQISATENLVKSVGTAEERTAALAELTAWFDEWLAAEASMLRRLRVYTPAELTVTLDRVEQIRRDFTHDPRRAAWCAEFLARLTAPNLGGVLARFEDPVARTAEKLGKKVDFEISPLCSNFYLEAAWTPVVESLIHLLNNAVDHGIEAPADRIAVGKSERGRIQIRAEDRGHAFVIVTADDGRGVDVAKLRVRLAQRGIAVDRMSDAQVTEHIFLPDVSTKDVAGDISGQGVGLAALAERVRTAGGTLTVARGAWGGAEFTLELPRASTGRLAS